MKYTFVINATISLGIEVEAGSLEEAVELAQQADYRGFCHKCSGHEPGKWSPGGELDCGAPSDCELVDLHLSGEAIGSPAAVAAYDRACELWDGGVDG